MTFEYPHEVIEARVAERKALEKRVKELETALIAITNTFPHSECSPKTCIKMIHVAARRALEGGDA